MQTDKEKIDAVQQQDLRRLRAMHAGDTNTLEDILHEDFYYTHFSGRTDNRRQYLNSISSGFVSYELGKSSEEKFFVYDGCVVMQGRLHLDCDTQDGQHFAMDNAFTAVWHKDNNSEKTSHWQMVAYASTAFQSD